MITEIGLMVGAYIAMRMLRLLFAPEGVKEHTIIQVFAAFILLGVVIIMIDLIARGFSGGLDNILKR